MLSHSFCGSGILAWLSWVLYKPAIKVQASTKASSGGSAGEWSTSKYVQHLAKFSSLHVQDWGFIFLLAVTCPQFLEAIFRWAATWPPALPKPTREWENLVRWVLQSFLFFFWPHHAARGILVPWPRIGPVSPAVEAQSLNHWTAREVPGYYSLMWCNHIIIYM